VQDPAVAFAGTKTVCVSPAANYSDCPAGAAQQTAMPTSFSGKRVLLHKGETFGNLSLQDGNSGVVVGSYGSTGVASVGSVSVGGWRPNTANFANDISIMDLNITAGITQSLGSRILFYRNTLKSTGPNNGIYIGGIRYWAQDDPYRLVPTAQFTHAHEIFVVENTVTGSVTGDGYNLFGDASQLAIMGNTMGTSMYHTLRLTAANKAVIASNELRGRSGGGIYHALKLHAGGLGTYNNYWTASKDTWASNQVVITDNLFGSSTDNNQWTVAICPENDTYAEGVQNVLIDSNRFYRGTKTVQDLTLGGRLLTYRKNTVTSGANLLEGLGHIGGLPAEWNGPYYKQ